MNAGNLGVVVVTHRGGELLERALSALRPQLSPRDELLVVVSNRPGVVQVGAPTLQLADNLGFARAANAGIRALGPAEGVLLLNDDTVPQPGFLEALRGALTRGPGLYQPRILLADGSGRLDNAGHGLFPDGFNWARGREDADGPGYDQPAEVGACSGAAMLIHREVLAAIGAFDEDLEAFGEDVDLSLRARRRGFALRYVPEARIEHALGATYGRYGARKVFLVERNRVRAALRSLPASALLTMPAWTGARVAAVGAAALRGRGWGARLGPSAAVAGVAGLAAGLLHAPDALRKRRLDADNWQLGELDMWRHLLQGRVRWRDLSR